MRLQQRLPAIAAILVMIMCFPGAAWSAGWNDYWVYGWHDEISGYDVYHLSPGNEKVKDRMVIMHNPAQGEWVRLEERIQSVSQPYMGKFPGAWVMEKGKEFTPYENYHYDILNNRLILGKQYQISPDGKWGIQYNDYYESPGGRIQSFLLKNLEDGSIGEWLTTKRSIWYYWLSGSRVLFCTYSTEEKQNVIYIFDPETKSYEKVVSGSLRAYDRDNNRILFVKNEPMRKNWVLDLSTMIEAREDNTESFYPSSVTPKVPLPPLDLELGSLKILSPERVNRYEHEIHIGKEIIPVPYVFQKDSKEFIPLRPLMEPLGIKVDISRLGNYIREYQVSYKEEKFTLSEGEYINYRWQLFVTPEVLKELGLPEFTVKGLVN